MIHVKKSISEEFFSRFDIPRSYVTEAINPDVVIVVDEFIKESYVCTHGDHIGILFVNLDDFEEIFNIMNEAYRIERRSPKLFISKVMDKLLLG